MRLIFNDTTRSGFVFAFVCLGLAANGQLLRQNFSVFGKEGVQIGTSSQIATGDVGSSKLVQSSGTASFGGNIHAGGQVKLANSNTISGNVTVANAGLATGSAFQMGSNALLSGTANVSGDVVISGGTINGPVTYSGTYSGPEPTNGKTKGIPQLPALPNLPSTESPSYAGGENITASKIISPGSWGTITLNGGQTLTFSRPGVYIFRAIKNSGNFNKFVFNFPDADGKFKIYIVEDVALYKINISTNGKIPGLQTITNADLAARVFMQVSGIGSTSPSGSDAWTITNGASGNNQSTWIGTVWAPNGTINVGSGSSLSKIIGALWSGKNVVVQNGVSITHAAFIDCSPVVNAGTDKHIDCDNPNAVLTGSSTGTGVQYTWSKVGSALQGTTNTASLAVNQPGTYVLSASSLECTMAATDTVVVTSSPCVLPYYPPPLVGKVNNKIGAELTSLYENFGNVLDDGKTLFIIKDGKVLIDVIVMEGNFETVKKMLVENYGLSALISNGPTSLIITGFYPISNLSKFDIEPLKSLVNFVRPSYPPLSNGGLIKTLGDRSMRTDLVRNGFKLTGDSVKVGVISDSYNTIANNDVNNGDLPGLSGDTVEVLLDYPYGQRSDEGRAMLQIVHDVAPKAKLAFRTGFITAGDMAQGIRELASKQCNVIVDDITFITEPFFKPGVLASAIGQVTQQGVHYVTAAGNFGVKSYEGIFNPSPTALPIGIAGRAHDFGGGDIMQNDSVKGTSSQPGIYTLVLQWENNIYSLGGNAGATTDLDAYAFDNMGNIIGFNRINFDGDPIEVLTFVATRNTTINLMIVNATNTSTPIRFKYVVFRGEFKINEHNQGFSTIVGQGNAPEAITVGAALYSNTPAFGVSTITRSFFSSVGGTTYNRDAAPKPDIVGPSGVNTSVNFGSVDVEGDGIPNFFGTSAAAPHVAGAVALLVEARKKFYRDTLSPAVIKNIITSNAIDMDVAGFDYNTGHGFIQADNALRSLANPTPQVNGVALVDSSLVLGAQPMEIIVSGSYLTSGTKVLLGTDTLQSAVLNSTELQATVPQFSGNQNLYLYSTPKSPLKNDGGLSDAWVLNGITRKKVVVTADNKTRKYGESNPSFTATITINGDTTKLELAELGLSNLTFSTLATPVSNVGIYFIRPAITFDSTGSHTSFLQQYAYTFSDGILNVQKMPLTITPVDQTIVYGEALTNVAYSYQFNQSNVADPEQFRNNLKLYHNSYVPSNALGVVKDFTLLQENGTTLSAADLAGMSMMTSFQALKNARRFQLFDKKLVPATTNKFNLYYVIDVASQSFHNYKVAPNSSSFVSAISTSTPKAILNNSALDQKIAFVSFKDTLRQMINGSLVQMVNSNASGMVPVVNGQLVQLVNGVLSPVSNGSLVQLVNGQLLQFVNGEFEPVPNGQLVQLINGSLVQMVNGQLVQIVNGQLVPLINGSLVQIINGQLVQLINGSLVPLVNGSLVQLINGQLVQIVNGALAAIPNSSLVQMVNGQLVPLINSTQLANGSLVQLINGSLVQLINGQLVQMVNASGISGTNNKTAVIVDESDITQSKGWLGAMFGINMITGLEVGKQKLVPGVFINENFDVTYGLGDVTIQENPCVLTHNKFTNFGSTSNAPTSMWLNVVIKISGQLSKQGDYVLFTGSNITFNNVKSTPAVTNFQVPSGKIVADANTQRPKTYFDLTSHSWVTLVPLGFSSTSDIFISGAIIPSSTGFIKSGNAFSTLKAVFYSNKTYNEQWAYAMAAYQPQFFYDTIAKAESVVAVNGTYRAGTPIPVLLSLVSGGSGGGGNNYTGSTSSFDNFTACLATETEVASMVQKPALTPILEKTREGINTQGTSHEMALTIFPNPAKEQVTVIYRPAKKGTAQFSVVNAQGKTVIGMLQRSVEAGGQYSESVPVGNLPPGLYIMRITNNKEIVTRKFVVLKK